jgi:hypothetical protein
MLTAMHNFRVLSDKSRPHARDVLFAAPRALSHLTIREILSRRNLAALTALTPFAALGTRVDLLLELEQVGR